MSSVQEIPKVKMEEYTCIHTASIHAVLPKLMSPGVPNYCIEALKLLTFRIDDFTLSGLLAALKIAVLF